MVSAPQARRRRSHRQAPRHQHRDVVELRCAPRERVDRREHPVDQSRPGLTNGRAEDLEEPLLSEFLVGFVPRVGHAVRKQHQVIAVLERVGRLVIRQTRPEQSEGCAGRGERHELPAGSQDDIVEMPRPDERDRARGRRELHEGGGDVLLG